MYMFADKIQIISARDMKGAKKGRCIKLMKKRIPKFKNEDEERRFWASHDSTEFVSWKGAKKVVLAKLKPSVKTISLRLPEPMLAELKLLAHRRDVPYQSLLKIFLAERIQEELKVI